MKKIIHVMLAVFIFLNAYAYAMDNDLLDLRNKIFDESKELKSLIANSKNMLLLNNMWDSCVVAITQLDAYFFMMGVFDSVSRDNWNEEGVNYLELWLNKIKNTNEVNIKSLGNLPAGLEPQTQVRAERLKGYFSDLNDAIDESLDTISKLKKTVKSNK
ncbi:MAG: hypothetical protein WC569_01565 [Candidatus Omnitrophota bacterium]